MENPFKLTEKYERNGWPSLKRPDIQPPAGWNLSLLTSLERIRSHALSSQGDIVYIKDGETLSDVFSMSSNGGWPVRITTDRPLAAYWDDEIPQWSPDGNWLAFGSKGHVHMVSRSGGLPKKITDFTSAASGPLSIIVAGANVHDTKLLDRTLEAIVVDRPKPTKAKPQNLCLDKGYDNPTGKAAVEKHKYTGHIRRIGEEKVSKGKKSIQLVGGLWKEH